MALFSEFHSARSKLPAGEADQQTILCKDVPGGGVSLIRSFLDVAGR